MEASLGEKREIDRPRGEVIRLSIIINGLWILIIALVALWTFYVVMEYSGGFSPVGRKSETSIGRAGMRRLLAAQVLIFDCLNYNEVEEFIIDLQRTGFNTLIVRAFQNRGDRLYGFARPRQQVGVYFETKHAPVVDPLLARIVSIGHRHGLRVFAWMETRNMPLRLSDPEDSRALQYDFETRALRPFSMWSIFDGPVVKRLVALYRDVVRTGVDGILFQDDLVMYQYEDFSPRAVALFEQETGESLRPSTLYRTVLKDSKGRWHVREYSNTFWTWSHWKNQKLLELANRLILAGREVNPRVQFAMNFMYESVTQPKYALAWLSQNIVKSKKFPIDIFAIMAYHRQIKKELGLSDGAVYEKIAGMTSSLLKLIDDPNKIMMKIQIRDWDTRKEIPSFEVDEVLRRVNSQGRVSFAFVPYSAKLSLNVIGRYFQ